MAFAGAIPGELWADKSVHSFRVWELRLSNFSPSEILIIGDTVVAWQMLWEIHTSLLKHEYLTGRNERESTSDLILNLGQGWEHLKSIGGLLLHVFSFFAHSKGFLNSQKGFC